MELAPKHSEVIAEQHEFDRQISIWLDDYEDIFSDFDPRPYADRALSDDFIAEVKKVSREDDFNIGQMNLLIPEKGRKSDAENIVVKRLHAFFRKNYLFLVKRARINRIKGVGMFTGGVLMMLLASYISSLDHTYYTNLLRVLFEPAGWFFVWTGMDMLFFQSRSMKNELNFYTKMAKTKVNFNSF